MMQEDFALHDRDFRQLAKLVVDTTGIVLSDRKRPFIQGRLGKRLRALGMSNFRQYCNLLETHAGDVERGNLINAITTNHTSFFRESHHFEHLTKVAFPLLTEQNKETRRIRIWSSACSTGEEPYSIAMTTLGHLPSLAGWDLKILATDLDTNVLAHASRGVYDRERAESIPDTYRKRFVTLKDDHAVMKDEARSLISFGNLNLLGQWPMSGPFDVIFCRNVVIYFDKDTQRRLFDRYAEIMRPDGWLIIGHSESLLNVTDRFDLVGRTIYRRIK
jgi:chemotaxis protein methyltransferase CheR